jgi:hypothetical protein
VLELHVLSETGLALHAHHREDEWYSWAPRILPKPTSG